MQRLVTWLYLPSAVDQRPNVIIKAKVNRKAHRTNSRRAISLKSELLSERRECSVNEYSIPHGRYWSRRFLAKY
jgi:hypothetical protein